MKKEFGYVTDREGNAVAGAEVYIKKQSDSSLVQLYSDDGSTTTSNPLTTDSDGEWSAYWTNGVYKIQIFVDGVQQQEINNHQHFDFSELTDPGADRIAFWDDSASDMAWLGLDTGLSISGTTLSLGLGTSVQAYDAELAAIAGLTSAADKGIQFTGDGTAATYDLTAAGKALLDDASASDQLTTLGLTANGKSLVTAADYAAMRTLLGVSNLAAPQPLTFNFTADSEARFYADVAMTLTEQATSGTGTIAYEKSTNAAPTVFSSTTSPIALEAGAWLKVAATSVSGIVAVHLKRTA